jgi:hypothetical protein
LRISGINFLSIIFPKYRSIMLSTTISYPSPNPINSHSIAFSYLLFLYSFYDLCNYAFLSISSLPFMNISSFTTSLFFSHLITCASTLSYSGSSNYLTAYTSLFWANTITILNCELIIAEGWGSWSRVMTQSPGLVKSLWNRYVGFLI